MRKSLSCLLFILGAVGFTAAQRGAEPSSKPESVLGTWSGTWEGAGSGGDFDLTLEPGKEGAPAGKVAVTGEPSYTAVFKSLSFDAKKKKMSARYDFPADESAEVVVTGSFDGPKATGTWSLQAKGTDTAVASGTWTVTRK